MIKQHDEGVYDLSHDEDLAVCQWLQENAGQVFERLSIALHEDHFNIYQGAVREVVNGMESAAAEARRKMGGRG